jgi:hypothetical protein
MQAPPLHMSELAQLEPRQQGLPAVPHIPHMPALASPWQMV